MPKEPSQTKMGLDFSIYHQAIQEIEDSIHRIASRYLFINGADLIEIETPIAVPKPKEEIKLEFTSDSLSQSEY
jgi:hypothetical protein